MAENFSFNDDISFDNKSDETQKTNDALSQDNNSLDNKDDIEPNDFDIDDNAIVLFEDDDFYLTDKGAISKSIIKQDNSKKEPDADKILGKFNSYEDLIKSYTELEKKLGANSEAVNKLREVEPVLPLLEAMINDENFLEMAERYFTDPEAQREQLMKSLGIEDGYQFDLNEALTNPNSKDAKILEKLQRGNHSKIPKKEQKSTLSDADKKAFMEKYGLDEKAFDDFVEKSKSRRLTLDDVYFILNKDEIIAKAKEEAKIQALKEIRGQQNNARQVGKSRSSNGAASSNKKSPEDLFIQALSGSSLSLFQ